MSLMIHAMLRMLRRKLYVFIFFCTIATLVFQNCAQQLSKSSRESSGNTSPFDSSKVQISDDEMQNLRQQQKSILGEDGSTILRAGVELVAVASESCLRARRGELGAGVHFIEKYLSTNFYSLSNEKFDQVAVPIRLQRDTQLESLKRLFARDKCMIGLSDDPQVPVATSGTNDPRAAQQDYLARIRYDEGEATIPKTASDQRVVTAIIDSGFDFANEDKPAYFSPILLGTDLSGSSFIPGNDLNDLVGHGTAIATLLASPENNNVGIRGLASTRTELLPIKVINSPTALLKESNLFMAIRRAVNGGAEVINLSVAGPDTKCSPFLGQAIYYGIERGAMFIISAGNGLTKDAQNNPVPGEVISPRDVGPLPTGQFIIPGCWGRYFKGAITVAALKPAQNQLSSFSNWGAWGVELAAPGEQIGTYSRNNAFVSHSGTSIAAVFGTAAAVKAISYHKQKNWKYSPWLIEDVIMNAMPEDSTLQTKVRKGKYVDWKSLSDYLVGLNALSSQQRLQIPTDDNEQGSGLNVQQTGLSTLTRIEVFSRDSIVFNQTDKIQFQVVAYYQNGSYKVVTRDASFSSSNSNSLSIDSSGVGYPNSSATGNIDITASYQTRTASTQVTLVNFSVSTGKSQKPVQLRLTTSPLRTVNNEPRGLCPVEAIYEDGSTRYVTHMSSFASSAPGIQFFNAWPKGTGCITAAEAFGNQTATIYAMYRGMYTTAQLDLPRDVFGRSSITILDALGSRQILPQDPESRIQIGGVIRIYPNGTVYTDSDQVSVYNIINPVLSSPNCVSLDAALKANSNAIDTSNLTPGTCTVRLSGEYRGSGVAQNITQNYSIQFVADPLVDFRLTTAKVYKSNISTIFQVQGINQSGAIINFPTGAVQLQILDSGGNSSLLNYVNRETNGAFVFSINKANENEQMIYRFKHLATNLQKDFRVAMEPTANSCQIPAVMMGLAIPQTYSSTLKVSTYCNATNRALSPIAGGTGSQTDPYRICTAQQLLSSGSAPRGLATAKRWYQLEDNLDFASYGNMASMNPKASIMKSQDAFNGNDFEIRNVTLVDSESDEIMLFKVYEIANLRLKDFLIQGRNDVSTVRVSTADRIAITGATVNGVLNVSILWSPSWIKQGFITNSNLRGTLGTSAFSSDRVYASYVSANMDRNGVPGTGFRAGLVSSYGSSYIYDVVVRGRVSGMMSGGGVVGDFPGCMKNVDAVVDVAAQDKGGGIAGSVLCNGPYTDFCGIENVTFNGAVSGLSAGIVANSLQTVRVKNITATSTLSATNGCGSVAASGVGFSVLDSNNLSASFACDVTKSGKIAGAYSGGTSINSQAIQIWPSDLGNVFNITGSAPTKKYGVSSIGDPAP